MIDWLKEEEAFDFDDESALLALEEACCEKDPANLDDVPEHNLCGSSRGETI